MRVLITGGAGFIGSHLADAYLALGTQTEPSEDCLSINNSALMYLHSCPDVRDYLCEFDGAAAVPSSY